MKRGFILSPILGSEQNDPRVKRQADLSEANEAREEDQKHNDQEASGLFSLLWNPLQAGLERVTNMFGAGSSVVENFQGQMDSIKMQAFRVFMRVYNKTYSTEELPRRMAYYLQRMQLIERSKQLFREGKSTFTMKPNRFLDWDEKELTMLSRTSVPKLEDLEPEERAIEEANNEEANENDYVTTTSSSSNYRDDDDEAQMGVRNNRTLRATAPAPTEGTGQPAGLVVGAEKVPAQFSWVDTGCVATPIDQGSCGSCYAVSTMSAIETTRCINQGSGATLSSEEIVDCGVRSGLNIHGCDGGWPTSVFKYLQRTRQVSREKCYPYSLSSSTKHKSCRTRNNNYGRRSQLQSNDDCQLNPSLTSSRGIQYKVLQNERDILYHVAKTGPVVTVLQTTNKLLFYGSGVMEDNSCSGSRDAVDHAITIVGYGRENNLDYWLIKNSWGTDWGLGGYAKVRRGQNTCSIGRWGWVMTG